MSIHNKYPTYTGDVNPVYGGTWFDLSTYKDGYVDALRVTDLDSACGFRGAVMVERITIHGLDDHKRITQALRCVGWTPTDLLKFKGHIAKKTAIAEALMSYGYADEVCDFDGPHQWIIQCEQNYVDDHCPDMYPMKYDGWTADLRLLEGTDLLDWLESNNLLDPFPTNEEVSA